MDTSREDACEFNGLQSNKLRQVSRARKSLSVDRMRSPHSDLNRWLSKVDVVKSVSGVRRSTSDLSLTSYEPQSHISFLTNTYPLRSAPLQLQADLEQPDNSAPNNQTGYTAFILITNFWHPYSRPIIKKM